LSTQAKQSKAVVSKPSTTASTNIKTTSKKSIFQTIKERPIEYLSVPCVAAFVGIMTNWMGVKMLFYPIDYIGYDVVPRDPLQPHGWFGWQGVVPTKTRPMAQRLTKIVTEKLLSLREAFGRLDPHEMSKLLLPAVLEHVRQESGPYWTAIVTPVMPLLLPILIQRLQTDIESVLSLEAVVLDAFVRDKEVLVDLFQKVGRTELEFLVNSGFGFGFVLGLGQMLLWALSPQKWTLPVAGAAVGYITNWVAIKLLFEPADPVDFYGLITVQGLFESRQIEVSEEFGAFMEQRVLNSTGLLKALATQTKETAGDGDNQDTQLEGKLFTFLRNELPGVIPSHIVSAAVNAIQHVATHPLDYPEIHHYVEDQLNIDDTLSRRLKTLTPTEFEDLLHPVFQEDEITLIVTGGVLGAAAGIAQTKLGWGGPFALRNAIITIISSLAMSGAFYAYEKYEEILDEEGPPLASANARPHLRRRNTILRIPPLEELESPLYAEKWEGVHNR